MWGNNSSVSWSHPIRDNKVIFWLQILKSELEIRLADRRPRHSTQTVSLSECPTFCCAAAWLYYSETVKMFHNDFNPSKCLITAEDATLKLLKKFTFTATLSVGLFLRVKFRRQAIVLCGAPSFSCIIIVFSSSHLGLTPKSSSKARRREKKKLLSLKLIKLSRVAGSVDIPKLSRWLFFFAISTKPLWIQEETRKKFTSFLNLNFTLSFSFSYSPFSVSFTNHFSVANLDCSFFLWTSITFLSFFWRNPVNLLFPAHSILCLLSIEKDSESCEL